MERRLVQAGGSLAVTLPAEIVVTKRFTSVAERLLKKRAGAYRELAK